MIWYRHLGFHNNPFSIKPAAFHDELLGYGHILEELEKEIAGKAIVFIEGTYGEGKTTILKRLLRRFGGRKKVAYFSCNRLDNNFDVKRVLTGRYGKFGRVFDIMPKGMILLLDEVQALSREDGEELLKYMRSGNVKSIVFVSSQYDAMKFPPEIVSRLKHYRLGKLSEDDAVHVVRSRVGKLQLLPSSIIKLIFAISKQNVRSMLKNCEAVCRRALELDLDMADEELVYEVLTRGVPFKEVKKPIEKPAPVAKPVLEKPVQPSVSDKALEGSSQPKVEAAKPQIEVSKPEVVAEPKEGALEELYY